jgi:Icc-related predicted phosphoesterase
MGNHEFYGQSMMPLLEECRAETQGTNIHLLENQSVQIGELTFLGCTLWTDFRLWPKPAEAMEAARDFMSDYKLIQTSSGRLHPKDTVKFHQASLAWMRAQLQRSMPEKTVIVTHHAPCETSIPAKYAGDILNGAFASDLKTVIKQCRVPLWIHGHTHHCVDYRIGETRIYSNQRGYPGEREAAFNSKATIDL